MRLRRRPAPMFAPPTVAEFTAAAAEARRMAAHEAGHAVLAARSAFRHDLVYVTLEAGGHCKFGWHQLPISAVPEWIVVLAGGAAGEALQAGEPTAFGWRDDLRKANEMLDMLAMYTGVAAPTMLHSAYRRAVETLEAWRPQWEAVRDELLRSQSISGEQVLAFVESPALLREATR